MPTLIFNSIECFGTKEAKDDELFINLRTENLTYFRGTAGLAGGNPLWGPTTMEYGDVEPLRDAINPVVFYEFAHIELWEDDPLFMDNHISTLDLRRPFSYGEDLSWNVPHDGIMTGVSGIGHGGIPIYQIRYDLLEEPSVRLRNRIIFISLECNDAQGTKDRIRLFANEDLIWGPHEMRTNDVVRFPRLYYDFYNELSIRLNDDRREDWTDNLHIGEREIKPSHRTKHVFSRDKGISGDYRYTLRYGMIQRPAS